MNKWTERSGILAAALVAGLGLGWVFGFRHGQNTALTATEDMLKKYGLLDEAEDKDTAAPTGSQTATSTDSSDEGASDTR